MTSTSNMVPLRLPVRARSRSRPRTASGNTPSSGTLTRSARVVKPSSRNSSPQHTQRRKPATMSKSRSLVDPLATLWTTPDVQQVHNSRQGGGVSVSSKMMRPSSWHLMQNEHDSFATSPWEGEQPYLDAAFPPLFPQSNNENFQYPSYYSNFQSRSTSHLPLANNTIQHLNYPLTDAAIAQDLYSMNQAMPPTSLFQDSNDSFGSGYQVSYPQSYTLAPQPFVADSVPPFGLAGPLTGSSPIEPLSSPVHDSGSKDDGEELVGMGLYDDPRDTSAWDIQSDEYQSLLLGAVSGKGLKLEESFIPQDDQPSTDGEDSSYEEEDAADEEYPEEDLAYGRPPLYTDEPSYTYPTNNTLSPFESELQQFDFTQPPQDFGNAGWFDEKLLTSFDADDLGAAVILGQASQGLGTNNYMYHAQ